MLNIFKLTDAISESAVGTVNLAAVQPYEFIGSMAECTSEFNYEVMSEAANFMEFYSNANEIMTEAAVMNPNSMDVLSESIFTKIKDGITKFIDKIIAMVKGVIEKLKAFFYRMTGKTDKWLAIMKPKIKAAQGRRGYSEASAEMHEWDVKYVTDGLLAGIDGLVKEILPKDSFKMSAIKSAENAILAVNINAAGADDNADSEGSKKALKELDDAIEMTKKQADDYKDKFPAMLASKLGVSDNSSLDAVWKAVNTKATGGDKKTVTYGNQVDAMVNAIEGSKKCVDGLKKAYDQHLKDLGNFKKEIESVFNKYEGKKFKENGAVQSAAKNLMSAESSRLVSEIQLGETACNNARGMNVSFVQSMTSEYMSVLTKFANFKEKKD